MWSLKGRPGQLGSCYATVLDILDLPGKRESMSFTNLKLTTLRICLKNIYNNCVNTLSTHQFSNSSVHV